MLGGYHDELGVARPLVRPPDHRLVYLEPFDSGAELLDHAGEVAALAGRERCGPALIHEPLADRRLARVDPGRLHSHEHLPGPRDRARDVHHVQDIHVSISIEPHRAWHFAQLYQPRMVRSRRYSKYLAGKARSLTPSPAVRSTR